MRKVVKLGGIYLSAGALIGLGTVGWLFTHKPVQTIIAVRPGTTGLSFNDAPTSLSDSKATTSASPTPVLSVSGNSAGAQGAVLGSSQGSVQSSSNAGSSSSGNNSTSLPGPTEFAQYDKYSSNATALYADVVAGTGAAVAADSKVTVQYRGWLTNGKEFDESYARGEPFTFTEGAGGVIAGWEQGLFGMKAGGTRRLIIPPSQGYGVTAQGSIPANSVLIFDVELVSVK